MTETPQKKVKRNWKKLSIRSFGLVFLGLLLIYPLAHTLGLRGYHPYSSRMLMGGHLLATLGLFLARRWETFLYVSALGLAVMGLGARLEFHFHDRGHRKFCEDLRRDRFCQEDSQQIICRPPSKMGGAAVDRSTCEEYR